MDSSIEQAGCRLFVGVVLSVFGQLGVILLCMPGVVARCGLLPFVAGAGEISEHIMQHHVSVDGFKLDEVFLELQQQSKAFQAKQEDRVKELCSEHESQLAKLRAESAEIRVQLRDLSSPKEQGNAAIQRGHVLSPVWQQVQVEQMGQGALQQQPQLQTQPMPRMQPQQQQQPQQQAAMRITTEPITVLPTLPMSAVTIPESTAAMVPFTKALCMSPQSAQDHAFEHIALEDVGDRQLIPRQASFVSTTQVTEPLTLPLPDGSPRGVPGGNVLGTSRRPTSLPGASERPVAARTPRSSQSVARAIADDLEPARRQSSSGRGDRSHYDERFSLRPALRRAEELGEEEEASSSRGSGSNRGNTTGMHRSSSSRRRSASDESKRRSSKGRDEVEYVDYKDRKSRKRDARDDHSERPERSERRTSSRHPKRRGDYV